MLVRVSEFITQNLMQCALNSKDVEKLEN